MHVNVSVVSARTRGGFVSLNMLVKSHWWQLFSMRSRRKIYHRAMLRLWLLLAGRVAGCVRATYYGFMRRFWYGAGPNRRPYQIPFSRDTISCQ